MALRADAAAPAAPEGAHARARARIHVHRREPLYIDTPCSGNLIDIPCCRGSTSTLRRALLAEPYAYSQKAELRVVEADLVPVVRRCEATSRQVQSPAAITRSQPQPRSVDSH